ncbi:MAG: hypothetical protein JNJ54_28195 [Myxococcaceae bacterium]|nr:hypothetical protein [Myxococcaceae bacterium]
MNQVFVAALLSAATAAAARIEPLGWADDGRTFVYLSVEERTREVQLCPFSVRSGTCTERLGTLDYDPKKPLAGQVPSFDAWLKAHPLTAFGPASRTSPDGKATIDVEADPRAPDRGWALVVTREGTKSTVLTSFGDGLGALATCSSFDVFFSPANRHAVVVVWDGVGDATVVSIGVGLPRVGFFGAPEVADQIEAAGASVVRYPFVRSLKTRPRIVFFKGAFEGLAKKVSTLVPDAGVSPADTLRDDVEVVVHLPAPER